MPPLIPALLSGALGVACAYGLYRFTNNRAYRYWLLLPVLFVIGFCIDAFSFLSMPSTWEQLRTIFVVAFVVGLVRTPFHG